MKIVVEGLCKDFKKTKVLKNVSCTFSGNNFIGILGPNGAGKSTLMKIITSQMNPTAGKVKWFDDESNLIDLKRRSPLLGYVHQNSVLDQYLTVQENIISRGIIKGLSKKQTMNRIDELNDKLEVSSLMKKRYGNLSGGQKRRVDIIVSLLHRPQLLILDEPTTGIDPEIRSQLWKAIHDIRKQDHLSVILITHYLEEMRDVDQLVVMLNGHINFEGDLTHFIQNHSNSYLQLAIRKESQNVYYEKYTYHSLEEKINLINQAYRAKNLVDFKDIPQSLEGAYLHLLNKEKKGGGASD